MLQRLLSGGRGDVAGEDNQPGASMSQGGFRQDRETNEDLEAGRQ